MNRLIITTIISLIYFIIFTSPVFSCEMDHTSHGHGKMEHSQNTHQMNHSKRMGKMIHNSTVDGYNLMYHLIDMSAHAKMMPEMKASHHLMLYIKNPDGQNIASAKVGYLITGPDNKKQKSMTSVMGGGFGSDVSLKDKGIYIIKAKALVGEKKIADSFQYTVK